MKELKAVAVLLAAAVVTVSTATAQPHVAQRSPVTVAPGKSTIRMERISPEICKVSFANSPLNLIVPETIASLNEAVKQLSKDDQVKVVVFTSEVAGYFYNHFDISQFANFAGQAGANGKPLWVELITNLGNAPFISIAAIHGRTQGGGDELALAFDLRYASRETAVFGQPEVGIGLFPGGGSTNALTRLAGRDRALEVLLSSDDYDAATAERYGWVTRALPEVELDNFVNRMASRLATFDRTALITVKKQINAVAFPQEPELRNSYSVFLSSLSWPGLQQRMPVFGKLYSQEGAQKVEQNLGFYIGQANKQLPKSK